VAPIIPALIIIISSIFASSGGLHFIVKLYSIRVLD
jgi:hypothetical protein